MGAPTPTPPNFAQLITQGAYAATTRELTVLQAGIPPTWSTKSLSSTHREADGDVVELQRLVVEGHDNALAVDFHHGLTIAFHENPAVRARFIDALLSGLGPGRDGLHLELTDAQNRSLAIFRPPGGRHRVIDIDRAVDVSTQFIAPNDRVDVLGRAGLDPEAALALIRVNANQVDRGGDTGTDNHRLARSLAAVDQELLWPAAVALTDADEELLSLTNGAGVGAIGQAAALQAVTEAHDAAAAATAQHRKVAIFGYGLTGLGAVIASVLFAANARLDDNNWTAKALAILGVLALVLTLADRRSVAKAKAHERRVLQQNDATSYDQLCRSVGDLADHAKRADLLAVRAHLEALTAHWRSLAQDAPADWALTHRAAIQLMAARRQQAAPYLAAELAADESTLADSARVLVDKIVTLRDVGMTREKFPMLLDEPFIGLGPDDVTRLLETVRRLATSHQIIMVTGDTFIQQWGARLAVSGQLGLIRIGVPQRPRQPA